MIHSLPSGAGSQRRSAFAKSASGTPAFSGRKSASEARTRSIQAATNRIFQKAPLPPEKPLTPSDVKTFLREKALGFCFFIADALACIATPFLILYKLFLSKVGLRP
jgi:hypothetical protein